MVSLPTRCKNSRLWKLRSNDVWKESSKKRSNYRSWFSNRLPSRAWYKNNPHVFIYFFFLHLFKIIFLGKQVQRNKQNEKLHGGPASNTTIQLPFLVVNTNKKTVIDCSISSDKMEYLFTFDDTFEIHDDIEVLKRMGMALGLHKADCTEENLAKVFCLFYQSRYIVAVNLGFCFYSRPNLTFQKPWNIMSTN